MEKILRSFFLCIFVMLGFMTNANAGYTGPELKLPLPAGYSWGVNTVPGSYYTHTGGDYYSIDFDDDIKEDAVGDFGENEVDVLAAAGGNASVHANYGGYGNAVIIDHGNGYSTIYGHLYSFAITGGLVSQGQVLGKLGDTGNSGGPHVHFQIMYNSDSSSNNSALDGVAIEGIKFTDFVVGNYYHSSNTFIPSEVFSAIQDKADELWAIRPRTSLMCDKRGPSGLICHEIQDMHWTDGDDPFVMETWYDGAWGEVELTYDPATNSCHEAFVVRGGFKEEYDLHDWDIFGAPLGDELDENDSSGYSAYDPYCTPLYGSSNKASCIEAFCGSSRTFTSVQRFEHATLCWNSETQEAECDPKWTTRNPACDALVICSIASEAPPAKGDLYDVNGTVYWYDGRSLRGVVSSDVFDSCGFNWGDVQEESEDVLDPLGWGENVDDPVDCGVLKDGDVFTTDATTTVYQYQAGLKRGITSSDVFNSCGFDWDEIKTFPDSSITSIPDGSVISSSSMCFLTPDLIWRELATGNLAAWYMAGTGISSSSSISSSDLSWEVVGSADFNRDGSLDLLWRHLSSPYELYLWEMDGASVTSSVLIAGSTDPSWVIRGVSDFTSDGEPDILWKNQYTGELAIWIMEGTVISSSEQVVATSSDTSWDIRATGDLTGDGSPDLLWRNPTTGELSLWEMDGTSYVSSITISSSSVTSWDIKAIGDFTSDGINDLLWRNPTTGELSVWQMNGTSYVSSVSMTTSSPAWDLVTVGGMSN